MILKKSDLMNQVAEQVKVNELVDIDLSLIGNDDNVDEPTEVTSNSTTDSHVDAVTQMNGKNRTNAQFGALDIANTLIEDSKIDEVVNEMVEKLFENFSKRNG